MIRVHRIACPTILSDNADQWAESLRVARAEEALRPNETTKKAREKAEKKYNHINVKTALKQMFSEKCAYCESHITHIEYGHIEHYKPKSIFPELCFDWNNFLLCCGVCNGKEYKGNKFPTQEEGGFLINPVDENPNDFFEFEFDVDTGTANILPRNQRGQTTETILGLNRPELVGFRSKIVRKIVCVAILAREGNADALTEIRENSQNDGVYSAFSRMLMLRYNLT